jgi:hypothetical protein
VANSNPRLLAAAENRIISYRNKIENTAKKGTIV